MTVRQDGPSRRRRLARRQPGHEHPAWRAGIGRCDLPAAGRRPDRRRSTTSRCRTFDDLLIYLESYKSPGDEVELRVLRAGQGEQTLIVTLGRPAGGVAVTSRLADLAASHENACLMLTTKPSSCSACRISCDCLRWRCRRLQRPACRCLELGQRATPDTAASDAAGHRGRRHAHACAGRAHPGHGRRRRFRRGTRASPSTNRSRPRSSTSRPRCCAPTSSGARCRKRAAAPVSCGTTPATS